LRETAAVEQPAIGSLQPTDRKQLTEDGPRSTAHKQLTVEGPQPKVTGADEDGSTDEQPDPSPVTVSLIPAQNVALRAIKKTLVELQNDTLEHLREEEGWLPSEQFTDRFTGAFSDLAVAVSGDAHDGGAGSAFGADLYDAVTTAIETVRAAGAGERAVAAAASKIFRTWRSDESERRVTSTARALAGTSTPI